VRLQFQLVALIALLFHASTAFAQKAVDDFDYDEAGRMEFSGRYIVPNEFENHLYSKYLTSQTGVYLGVGTFRGLNTAIHTDFSHVILFDIDSEITKFNRMHLEIIKNSKTKEEYMSSICRYDYSTLSETARKSIEDLCNHLRPDNPRLRDLTYRDFFFYSDEAFAKIREMALTNRITCATGSLTGRKALKKVADDLRSKGLAISAIDISNAHWYFFSFQERQNFFQNLKSLPHHAKAQLLFTDRYFFTNPDGTVMQIKPGTMDWNYYGINLDQFIHNIKDADKINRSLVPELFTHEDFAWKQEPRDRFIMTREACVKKLTQPLTQP